MRALGPELVRLVDRAGILVVEVLAIITKVMSANASSQICNDV